MSFYTYDRVECPDCPEFTIMKGTKREQTVRPELTCIESNYSGCCVDFGECPKCKKVFQVSYAPSEIKPRD